MATAKSITIQVSSEAAQVYEEASPEDRRKLDALLSLRLSAVSRGGRPLLEIMDEVSDMAQSRGLTPEILDELLSE
jgi:hypothetical protein